MLTSNQKSELTNIEGEIMTEDLILTSSKTKALTGKSSSLTRLEEERMKEDIMAQEKRRDIQLLLENLFKREETTVKMVLACLYDVGSINLINKKISNRSFNGLMKYIATLSKSLFLIIAIRWFHKNVPTLLTDWLLEQVDFN